MSLEAKKILSTFFPEQQDDDESKWTQLFFSPEAQDSTAGAGGPEEDASTSFDPNGIPIVEDVLVTEPANLVHQVRIRKICRLPGCLRVISSIFFCTEKCADYPVRL